MNPICACGKCNLEVSDPKNKYIYGHNGIGEKFTEERKRKISESLKSKKVQKKKIKTCIKRYGVENPSQSNLIKEKKKQTSLDHFGVENPNQLDSIKEKKKQTSLDHFGVENPNQSNLIKEKKKRTCTEKYGGTSPYCSEEIRHKGKLTCLKNHGVDNYSKTSEFREFSRGQMINAIEAGLKDGEKFTPRKGNNEISVIRELQLYTSYFIDNDARIINYFPDGYIKELNIVIELDESYHNNKYAKKRDLIKDEDYKNYGLTLLRIKEKDWLENKEKIINEFEKIISEKA